MATYAVSINVHEHGNALDGQKKRVQCNYCGKVVSGFSRLKCHLGGIRGDVTPCMEVPENVRELMRNMLLEKKKGSLSKEVGEQYHPNLPWKRNSYHSLNPVSQSKLGISQTAECGSKKRGRMDPVSENSGTESISFPDGTMVSGGAFKGVEDPALAQVQKCIGRFFYETGIDFSVAKSPSFQKMINATLGCGQVGLKIPSGQELEGWILQNELEEIQQYVNEIRDSWATTGCSILLDGWIDGNGRNLVNVLVDCPRGAIYLRSSDISAFAGDADAMQFFCEEIFAEVGLRNVVQVITYSTSPCMNDVGKLLMEKHKTLFWTVSASHCIEMMLEKICTLGHVKGTLEDIKTITNFIHSKSAVVKLVRDYTSAGAFVIPCKISSASFFLTLETIVSEEEGLKRLFKSSDWNTSTWAATGEGKRVADLVADDSFWTGATTAMRATIPLVRALELINAGDNHRLGYIYETIDQTKEAIKKEFKNKKSQYIPVWEAIDEIWDNYLHSPLHSAGYFFNPSFFYSSDFCSDTEVWSGVWCCTVKMVEDRPLQDLITVQIERYRGAKGEFHEGSALDCRSNISPALWWSKYGGECPELKLLAIRILSQTCDGATKYGLRRGLAERLVAEGGHGIEHQRLRDLAFVQFNLQLRNFGSGGESSTSTSVENMDPPGNDDSMLDEAAPEIVPPAPDGGPTATTTPLLELECARRGGDAPTPSGTSGAFGGDGVGRSSPFEWF